MSLDGYIGAKDGQLDWLIWNFGPEWKWDQVLQKTFIELTSTVDCILLSRKMAVEGFIGHWAKVADNPEDPQSAFAKKITDARKVVFTKTLHKSEWVNTMLAKGDLVTEVNSLKGQEGKDMVVYGGAGFASSLIRAGLIDELNLFVNPVALGDGKAIFQGLDNQLRLELLKAQSYDCGVTLLQYKIRE